MHDAGRLHAPCATTRVDFVPTAPTTMTAVYEHGAPQWPGPTLGEVPCAAKAVWCTSVAHERSEGDGLPRLPVQQPGGVVSRVGLPGDWLPNAHLRPMDPVGPSKAYPVAPPSETYRIAIVSAYHR